MTRRFVPLLLLAFVILGAGVPPAGAQSPGIREAFTKKVSLEVKELPLRKALEKLFEGINLPLVVDPNVPDPKVSGKWTDRRLPDVLHELAKLGSTEKTRILGVFGTDAALVVVNPNTVEEEKQFLGAGRKVRLSLKDVPLQRAMDMIFMASGLQYSVHPAAARLPVTVELKDTHIELALSLLESAVSKNTPLAVTKEGDVYYLRVAP